MDSFGYTFNGRGEFRMVEGNGLKAQFRAESIFVGDQLSDATVFTSIVAKQIFEQSETDTVEFRLNDLGDDAGEREFCLLDCSDV